MADKKMEQLSADLFPTLDKKEKDKNLKLLKASFDMYENTIKETREIRRSKFNEDGSRMYSDEDIDALIATIVEAQKDIIEKYVAFGGNKEDLYKKMPKKSTKAKANMSVLDIHSKKEDKIKEEVKREKNTESNTAIDKTVDKEVKKDENRLIMEYKTEEEAQYLPTNSSDPTASFDVIPLPSKGECYPVKMSKVNVNYLTAYDENILASPNAYKENLVLDLILNRKVFNNQVDIMDMTEGDREAIILYLRAAGYGNDYPIIATDTVTGQKFEANIDLSKLAYKPFKLKGDSNGWFDFKAPVSKDLIKFRFLNHRDILRLKEIEVLEKRSKVKSSIGDIIEKLNNYIDIDETLNGQDKTKVMSSIKEIENWHDKIDDVDEETYSHNVTNALELEIMSVNGNTDREFIHEYVQKMGVKDSRELRKYVAENEPGIDYLTEIEKPESLGGGSMKVTFQPDQYVFLNYIA